MKPRSLVDAALLDQERRLLCTHPLELGACLRRSAPRPQPAAPPEPAVADKRKQSLWLTSEILAEVEAEAKRTDRSVSWLLQHAWRIAHGQLKKLPSVP